ncbi:MAG: radical SAM protein [Candidatus Glassbacteria bacterium]|nr:radical SAM protein [Candidatus Glassbacteria bacterium]
MSKVIRFFRFLHDFKKGSSFPRVANYEITSRCNLSCEHCYCKKNPGAQDHLSDEQWSEVFTEHKARGVTFSFLTGGEPTLRMPVIEAADHIFNGLAIASNGVIKVPEQIRRRLFISLDGPPEVHNRIRGKDVFDTVMNNIAGDRRVIVSPTLSTTNYEHIDELIRITRESGVEGISFSLYTSHVRTDDPLLLKGEKLEWVIEKLLDGWKKNRKLFFMTPYIINLLRNKPHKNECFFRGSNFISFDARMQEKKPCVLGAGVNCATCGCIVPMISYALKKMNLRSWFMLNRMFPTRYFKA